MDLASIDNLAATALGGLIAAGAVAWQSSRQRKWQLADLPQQLQTARDAEVRQRADEKADEALRELDTVARLLQRRNRSRSDIWPADRADNMASREALENVDRAALYLQDPLRTQLLTVTSILWNAEQLICEGFVSDDAAKVTWVLIRHARRVIGQYLRGEAVDAQPPHEVLKYVDALSELDRSNEAWASKQEAQGEEGSSEPAG